MVFEITDGKRTARIIRARSAFLEEWHCERVAIFPQRIKMISGDRHDVYTTRSGVRFHLDEDGNVEAIPWHRSIDTHFQLKKRPVYQSTEQPKFGL